jgi:hypothetical protein
MHLTSPLNLLPTFIQNFIHIKLVLNLEFQILTPIFLFLFQHLLISLPLQRLLYLSYFHSVVRKDEVANLLFILTCETVHQGKVEQILGFSFEEFTIIKMAFYVIAKSLYLFLLGFVTSRCRFGPVSLLNSFYSLIIFDFRNYLTQ